MVKIIRPKVPEIDAETRKLLDETEAIKLARPIGEVEALAS